MTLGASVTPRAIVTDIEGTTSGLAFVHEVLFPYSRARLAAFVAAHPDEAAPVLDAVRAQAGAPTMDDEACVVLLAQWHDADLKIGPLKTLQGLIWADGYASGDLKGHVYPDAAAGLRRWRARGVELYVYSSGSAAAQKLLFGYSDQGDLSGLFRGHFDTAIGGKQDVAAYRAIAKALGLPAADILFLSDVQAELAAAQEAGFAVILLAREGSPPPCPFPVASSFDAILPVT